MLARSTKEGRPSTFARGGPALGAPFREDMISARRSQGRNVDPSMARVVDPPLGKNKENGFPKGST